MRILRAIVGVLAVLSLLKAVWLLGAPKSARALIDWWLGMSENAARRLGYVTMGLGVVVIALAIVGIGNATVAVVTIFGTAMVLMGMAYQSPHVLRAIGRPFGKDGRPWVMRAAGGLSLAAALLLFLVWLRGA